MASARMNKKELEAVAKKRAAKHHTKTAAYLAGYKAGFIDRGVLEAHKTVVNNHFCATGCERLPDPEEAK